MKGRKLAGAASDREQDLLHRQQILARFGELALRSDDLDEILHEACRLVGEALGTDLAKVMELQEDGITLLVRAGIGWQPGVVGQVRVRADRISSEGHALRTGKPVASADIEAEKRFEYEEFIRDAGVKALSNVPIIGADSQPPYGILEVDSRTPREFTGSDTSFLRGYANLLAAAVARLKLLAGTRRADAALRESETRLGALVTASSEVIYSMNADWTEVRQLTGGGFVADTGTANPHWLADYIPGEEQPRVADAIARAIGHKEIFSLEHRVRLADGGVGWVQSRAVPLFDPGGGITEWFGAANDVTARREAEDALRRLNSTLEQQVEQRTRERDRLWRLSHDPFLIADAQGRWLSVNPAWTSILGWSEAELLGRTSEWMEHPDDRAPTRTEIGALAGGATTRQFENRFRARDGSYHWFAWTAVPSDGLLFCVARDITGEKEQAVAHDRLEEQLRQSQKMEAVGQLTGGLAHDFNNLLTGVTGSLELLQTRIAQGRIKDVERYVSAAQGAANRAAALTHRLLAFSRQQALDPRPTDMNQLIAGMEDLIQRTVGPAIKVEVVAPPGLPPALVDPNQLENALLNLCINARDAMPDGGTLVVEAGHKRVDERMAVDLDMPVADYLTLGVTDNGTGMPPEVIARAFDPFFTTKPVGKGTGLGLSMIYGFVRQSGGQARIHSRPGHGTTVCLFLPPHAGGTAQAEPQHALADAPRAHQGETVLVVDDEPTVRMLVTEVLEDLGYTVIEAPDGAAGLHVLRSDARIDLLMTDVGLPGSMNGRQVAEAGRALRPELKVLFITGYAENAVLGHGHLEAGMQIMAKPFTMEVLATRIKAMIAGT